MITLIAAMDKSRGIGKDGDLPWPRISKDLQFFKKQTVGHTVVMGRKTYESLGMYKPLPDRHNVVVTRQTDYEVEKGVIVCPDLESALAISMDLIVIGGGELYKQAMPFANKLIITQVHGKYDVDTYFPRIDPEEWEFTWNEDHLDEPVPFTFLTLRRY